MALPENERVLTMAAETMGAKLSPESLLSENTNVDLLHMEFNKLHNEYAIFYIREHNQHQKQLSELENRIVLTQKRAEAINFLNPLLELSKFQLLPKRVENIISNCKKCRIITTQDFLEKLNPYCNCRFMPDEQNIIESFLHIEDETEKAYKETATILSQKLSNAIMDNDTRDDIEKLVDSLQVTNLDKLPDILDAKLLDTVKRILGK